MPIYEYVCAHCGRRVEVIHGVHAEGPTSCESCGGVMRKALSAPAIVFKGSGWAKVDARAASSKSTASASPSTDKGDGAAGAGDTKPEKSSGSSDAAPGAAGATTEAKGAAD